MSRTLVLLVDDSEDDRELISLTLKRLGNVELLCAATVEEGLELFRTHRDELKIVLLDGCLGSGQVDTIPILREIEEVGFTGHVIAISSSSEFRSIMLQHGATLGVDKGYLSRKIAPLLG